VISARLVVPRMVLVSKCPWFGMPQNHSEIRLGWMQVRSVKIIQKLQILVANTTLYRVGADGASANIHGLLICLEQGNGLDSAI